MTISTGPNASAPGTYIASHSISATRPTAVAAPGSAVSQDVLDDLTLRIATGQVALSDLPAPDRAALQQANLATLNDAEVHAGSDLYAVLALIQDAALKVKQAANLQKAAASQAAVNEQLKAADQMETAAKDRFQAAEMDAGSEIAGGAISIGMGGSQTRMTAEAGRAPAAQQREIEMARWQKDVGLREDEHLEIAIHERAIVDLNGQIEAGGEIGVGQYRAQIPQHEAQIEAIRNRPQARHDEHMRLAKHYENLPTELRARVDIYTGLSRGMESVMKGVGSSAAAAERNKAELADVEVKRRDAAAEGQRAASERAGELASTAQSLVQSVQEARQAILSSSTGTIAAMARNIA